jgi:hypothetical protein
MSVACGRLGRLGGISKKTHWSIEPAATGSMDQRAEGTRRAAQIFATGCLVNGNELPRARPPEPTMGRDEPITH